MSSRSNRAARAIKTGKERAARMEASAPEESDLICWSPHTTSYGIPALQQLRVSFALIPTDYKRFRNLLYSVLARDEKFHLRFFGANSENMA